MMRDEGGGCAKRAAPTETGPLILVSISKPIVVDFDSHLNITLDEIQVVIKHSREDDSKVGYVFQVQGDKQGVLINEEPVLLSGSYIRNGDTLQIGKPGQTHFMCVSLGLGQNPSVWQSATPLPSAPPTQSITPSPRSPATPKWISERRGRIRTTGPSEQCAKEGGEGWSVTGWPRRTAAGGGPTALVHELKEAGSRGPCAHQRCFTPSASAEPRVAEHTSGIGLAANSDATGKRNRLWTSQAPRTPCTSSPCRASTAFH